MNVRRAALAAVAVAVLLASCGEDQPSGPRLRVVLAPEESAQVQDLDSALDGTREVIERRIDEFGLTGAGVERTAEARIVVELPDATTDEAVDKLGRSFLLQFCEPIIDEAGNIAVVSEGTVQYLPQTCEPKRDAEGNATVEGGTLEFVPWATSSASQTGDNPPPEQIVWQAAKAELDGVETALDSRFLRPNAFVEPEPVLGVPILTFEWDEVGAEISEQVTARLEKRNYPLAPFLDGEPIIGEDGRMIAPRVQTLMTSGGSIVNLSLEDSEELATLLNTGPFPLPIRVVDVQEVAD